MWYEINVTKDKMHFFATHERSIVTEEKLIKVLKTFQDTFKKDDGYEIMVYKRESTAQQFTHDEVEEILAQYK